jgi:hypothetical protein
MQQGFIGKTLYEKIASLQEKEVIALFEQNPEALAKKRHGRFLRLDSASRNSGAGAADDAAPLMGSALMEIDDSVHRPCHHLRLPAVGDP